MDYTLWIRSVLLVMVVAFGICIVVMPRFIPLMHKLKFGQSIRLDGPQSHLSKQGTPTMGGIVFVLSSIIAMFIINPQYIIKRDTLAITLVFLGYFGIGLADDLIIIVKKQNEGLSVKWKLFLQVLIAILFVIVVYPTFIQVANGKVDFFGNDIHLGNAYIIFVIFMFVAYSNATNLTDGLDGLSSITMVIALFFMSIIAIYRENFIVASYCGALIGGLLGFYCFNKRPAKIFMGDTGSLAIGGFYAVCALLLNVEFISVIIGMVFVLETLSVMIQVFHYKRTKNRIFRMAPLHHHFELGPLKEKGTVRLFYLIGIIFGILGMVIFLA